MKIPFATKKMRRAWRRVWVVLPHPSFFAMASLFFIGFAHIDRSSTIRPLSNQEILKTVSLPSRPESKEQEPPKIPSLAWDFFHPAWKEKSNWSLNVFQGSDSDPVADPTWDARFIVEDPSNRIEKEFRVTPQLQSRVIFWINVFARYNSNIRVVHDRSNPDIIYGYIDLRPIFRTLGATEVAEKRARKIESQVIAELKAKLLEASRNPKTPQLSTEERTALREILSKAGALNPQDTARLIDRVRTQTGQRDMFLRALNRSRALLPHIESVFKQAQLPVALARIPFVESSFNADAQSKIGAMGIWQFTKETAKEFIHADEERLWADPLAQTKSAARLLMRYRSALPDWGCTVTSYNSGIGRVRRMIENAKLSKVEDLIASEQANGLGFAGKNFYAEFLAVNLVEAYKEEIFAHEANQVDSGLVFKGKSVFPNQSCDL